MENLIIIYPHLVTPVHITPVMNIDPSGEFAASVLLFCTVIGGLLGYIAAVNSGSDTILGTITGAILGAMFGAIATAGKLYSIGAWSSVTNKAISDISSTLYYGTNNFGSWEDYAIVFIVGGFIRGSGAFGSYKLALEAGVIPLFSQLSKMGTRGAEFDAGKLAYSIVSRAITSKLGSNIKIIGLELNPVKAVIRGLFSGLGRFIYD